MKRILTAFLLAALSLTAASAPHVRGVQVRSVRAVAPPPPDDGDVILIGTAEVGDGAESNGVYTLTARGNTDPDDGTFWPLDSFASGDAQISWSLQTELTGDTVGNFSGAGAQLRSGTDGAEKMLLSWWPDAGRCRFKYRGTEDGAVTGGILGTSEAVIGHHCAITYESSFPRARFWESVDGDEWVLVNTVSIELDYPFTAGLYCLGEQANAVTVTCVIDNVQVSDTVTITDSSPPPDPDDPPPVEDSDTYNQGFDLTANIGWQDEEKIVPGWYWALPPNTAPASNSGVFNGNTSYPSFFEGNRLLQCNAYWRDLEPTNDNYNFSSIVNCLTNDDYEGVMLNVRGITHSITNEAGQDSNLNAWSAPPWIKNVCPTLQEGLHDNVRVRNCLIYDPFVLAEYKELIRELSTRTHAALGGSTIPAHPHLIAQIIHGVSSSQGEEWTGTQSSRPEAVLAMIELLEEWQAGYGVHAKKLAWLKENPIQLFNAAVTDAGTGIRGGAIESWLRGQYTSPGKEDLVGQEIVTGDYLEVNEDFLPIKEQRHFQDQNEAYAPGRGGPPDKWPMRYRNANLRMIQMRRNVAWLVRNSTIDPRMDNWMGLSLGRTSETSPQAWIWLMQSHVFYGGQTRNINNLEYFLRQRESQGATTATTQIDHGSNVAGNNNLPANQQHVSSTRRGASIGIAVDDAWLTGAWPMAIMVTFLDEGTQSWSLNYDDGDEGVTRTVTKKNTGELQTAIFNAPDFEANETGITPDFTISASTTDIAFVRLVKCNFGPTCGF